MSELLRVGGTENPNRLGDVVFVHGLNGHPQATWTSPSDNFWPQWVAEDWPNLGVWSLGYAAAASGWFGTAMPLVERATNALDYLDASDLGAKPICFITHSMGGLLVKQMLRNAYSLGPAYRHIGHATRRVVFISTPHTGSRLADYLDYFHPLTKRTAAVKDLQHGEVHLRDLNTWYRNNARELQVENLIFYEALPTGGVFIVDANSADPGLVGTIPVPIDADHLTICKPPNRTAHVYARIHRFLRQWLAEISDRQVTIDLEGQAFNATDDRLLRAVLAKLLAISPGAG